MGRAGYTTKECPGCGRSGWEVERPSTQGVCDRCRRRLDSFEHLDAEMERMLATYRPFSVHTPFPRIVGMSEEGMKAIQGAVLALLQRPELAKLRWADERMPENLIPDDNYYASPGKQAIYLDPETAQAVRAMWSALRDFVRYASEKANAHANNFFGRLANGEISIAEIDQLTGRHAP